MSTDFTTPASFRHAQPYVIAEMAGTHEGDFPAMLRLVEIAAEAGANAVKTAWCSSAIAAAERMHAPELAAMYGRLFAWPAKWLTLLRVAAQQRGLEFLCTVDCPADIAVVARPCDRLKIASWGATDLAFVREHARHGKPLVVSTGTCSVEELCELSAELRILRRQGRIPEYWVLHCVSAYPAPLEDLNLSCLTGHSDLVGFSDHTRDPRMGAWAVAAGAKVLEVHYRGEDTRADNPDYAASLAPEELRAYIRDAREAYVAMGYRVKQSMPSEEPNRRYRYADR